ncbi:hypothetical protein V6N11_004506 [Hibiscus sabdariffa]|uniref:Secreted protein n=1 Tax=Hibiscus sabdariffa TaxID=183260 RepID=A0ABR2SH58_9ROSI
MLASHLLGFGRWACFVLVIGLLEFEKLPSPQTSHRWAMVILAQNGGRASCPCRSSAKDPPSVDTGWVFNFVFFFRSWLGCCSSGVEMEVLMEVLMKLMRIGDDGNRSKLGTGW